MALKEGNTVVVAGLENGLAGEIGGALGGRGYDVEFAGSAEEINGLALSGRPGLIIMDSGLGREALLALKSGPATGTPVMVLSRPAGPEEAASFLELGADGFMMKPPALAELAARARRLLAGGRASRDLELLEALPCGHSLQREVDRRIAARVPYAFGLVGIERLAELSGGASGETAAAVTAWTASLISRAAAEADPGRAMAGRLGVGELAFLCSPGGAEALALAVTGRFDDGIKEVCAEGGGIIQPSLVIGMASTASRPLPHFAAALDIAREIKVYLGKRRVAWRSAFLVDRRRA